LPGQATPGLTGEQFDELVARIEKRVIWDSGIGRPRQLTLRQAVKATIMYFKNNVTDEVIRELLFVDQSTVSRVISDLQDVLADVLAECVPTLATELAGRVGIVEGSLCPCWSWADAPELYSGKHQTTGHAHLFVCDTDGELRHICDPLPGTTHDAKALDDTGLADILHADNSIGDKGFIGKGPTTPFRTPPDGELPDRQKGFTAAINTIRYVIERAIANFTTWRCMFTDYRRPRRTYPTAFHAVRALHLFKEAYSKLRS
jgi:hypothetical protein